MEQKNKHEDLFSCFYLLVNFFIEENQGIMAVSYINLEEDERELVFLNV